MTKAAQAMEDTVVGSIVVDGGLTCALLYSFCDLKASQQNVLCSLIWEVKLYRFEQGDNIAETTKNICYTKIDSVIDHNTVTRWFKRFCLCCKNLGNKARSDKMVDP